MIRRATFFCCFLATVVLSMTANADTFDNETDWLASLCPGYSVVEEPYTLDVPDDAFGVPLESPWETTWGSFDTNAAEFNNGSSLGSDEGLILDDNGATLSTDASLGMLNGMSLCYSGTEITVNIAYVDGTSETVLFPATADVLTPGFHAWTNTTGVDVTSIELVSAVDSGNFILCTNMAFADTLCDDTPVTLQGSLEPIIDDLTALLPTGNNRDDNRINRALLALMEVQDDSFWVDGDRLNDASAFTFFARIRSAVSRLNRTTVDTSENVDAIIGLVDGVVDIAIDDAIADGAPPIQIFFAQLYQVVAQDAAANGNPVRAVNLYRVGWAIAVD